MIIVDNDFSKLKSLIDRPAALIIDKNVLPLWKGPDIPQFAIDVSEERKSRETKSALEDALLNAGFGRDCMIIAMGGGVLTDLAGFVAATFCRGVPHINIPTTLLGMVDASVGGKTGVNHPLGKNLVGAFHPPKAVFINTDVLKTLPQKQWRMGWVEMVKHGLIASSEHFSDLESQAPIEKLIHDSYNIKLSIVKEDPKETGKRRLLNFGHTIGHAIEWASNYQLTHGEAVLMGLLAESRLSPIPKESLARIEKLLLPHIVDLPPTERIFEALLRDKKAINQIPRFVLLEDIGKAHPFSGSYCQEINPNLALEALNAYRRH